MTLKLFSDRNYLYDDLPPDPILLPFWSDFLENKQHPWLKAWSRYAEVGNQFFEMVPLKDADFAVLPMNWRSVRGDAWRGKTNQAAQNLSLEFARRVQRANKPLIVFFSGDCSHESLPFENAIVFRTAAYRSRLQPNEFIGFAGCDDLIEQFFPEQPLPIRPKSEKPTVGFCGFTRPDSLKRKLQSAVYHSYTLATQFQLSPSPYRGQILRNRAIELLQASPRITTNFILRGKSFFDPVQQANKQMLLREYVDNLINSDYALCCRGSANYSIRLFEILCCGRIPVLIDTDSVLPYDFAIDWKKYCVWVNESELDQIPEKIAEFHARLSPNAFVELQQECRKLWQDWLSPEGFYRNFHRHFENNRLLPRVSQLNVKAIER